MPVTVLTGVMLVLFVWFWVVVTLIALMTVWLVWTMGITFETMDDLLVVFVWFCVIAVAVLVTFVVTIELGTLYEIANALVHRQIRIRIDKMMDLIRIG